MARNSRSRRKTGREPREVSVVMGYLPGDISWEIVLNILADSGRR
jgi:hypothetical protein